MVNGLRVVWPILGYLLVVILSLGFVIAYIEGWTVGEAMYFAMITALTIGFGDLTPKGFFGRFLAVVIGIHGIVFSGVMVAVAIQSLKSVLSLPHHDLKQDDR